MDMMSGGAPEQSTNIEYIEWSMRKIRESIQWYDDKITDIQNEIRNAQYSIAQCDCDRGWTLCPKCERAEENIDKDFERLEDEIIGRHIHKQRIGALKLRILSLKRTKGGE